MNAPPRRDTGGPESTERSGATHRSFWIADLAIRQPVFITMVALAVIVVGIVAYGRIGIDLFPDVSLPIVVVQTTYPGASPDAIEQSVTAPIEDGLISLAGVDTVRSTSTTGSSLVVVEFAMSQDSRAAADAVRARLNLIRNRLPADASEPVVETFDPSAAPILSVAVADTTGTRSPAELRTLVDQSLKPALERVPGVAAVDVSGGQTREIHVDLQRSRLQDYGLAADRVVQAIRAASASVPAGQIPNGSQDALLRTAGQVGSTADLANVPIKALPGGAIVRVQDVASVSEGVGDVTARSRLDGRPTVIVTIQKQSGSNLVEVADAVKAELSDLERQYPDLAVAIASDQSSYTRESIHDLEVSLLVGALLAGLVVLLFFRDLRSALVTVAGLPVILLGTVGMLQALGVTLNTISLLALSLSVGMLIDDAIVVRENIFRHVERGEAPAVAASRGAAEIAPAVFAVTATIVAVFLPIGFTEGIAGKFLRDFGLTIAVSVLISLVEAFTLAPMLSAHFFPGARVSQVGQVADVGEPGRRGFAARVTDGYACLLRWSLRHRAIVVLVALLSLGASGVVFRHLAFSFVPASDRGTFTVSLSLAPATPLAETDRQAQAVEAVLRADGAVQHVFTSVGSSDGSANMAQLVVSLRAAGQTEAVVERLRPRIQAAIPGTAVTIDTQSSASSLGNDAAAGAVRGRPIQFAVQGADAAAVDQVSADLVNRFRAIPGARDVDRSLAPGAPGLAVVLDADKAAQAGVSAAQVGATLRALVSGESAGTLHAPGQDLDVVVRLTPSDRASAADLLKLPIATARGTTAPLSDLGQLVQETEPSQIDRANRQREVIVGADAAGRDQGAILADAQAVVDRLPLPAGVTVEASGQSQYTRQMLSALGLALGLAVLFVYMILASQFGSFVQPFIIMLALPFSLLGALLALFLSGFDFDMLAMIGVILLMGLVSKNSILLVDLANGLRRDGLASPEAMLAAGPVRLRPILMTTFAMIGGMIPVALGVGAGSEVRRPMGVTVIGGLLTSTLLTLVVVPVVYTLVADAGKWLRRLAAPGERAPARRVRGGWARSAAGWVVVFALFGGLVWRAAAPVVGAPSPAATPTAAPATPLAVATFAAVPASTSPPSAASPQVAVAPAQSPPVPLPVAAPAPAPASPNVQVANTAGLGLNLRGSPGTDLPPIGSLPEGAPLQQLGDPTSAGGRLWVKVRDRAGQVGWVAQDYLAARSR